MKIAIVTTWFERGAAYVSKQYEQLLEENHEVFIYARGGEKYAIGDPKWDKENVWWGKKYKIPINTYIDNDDFQKFLLLKNIEIVFFNEQTWYQPIVLCKRLGIKVGAYIDYYTENTLELFDIYDFLICNTKRHYSAFLTHKQVYYIPWGTDTKIFKPSAECLNNNKNITFFHSAGMNPFRKGTDFLLQAYIKIVEKYPDSKLVIHSQVNLIKFFPKLKQSIQQLIKTNNLELIEKTVSAPGLYYMGDVYVYPSRIEGIGLSIAEALSSGLPVITSDNAPMNEFVNFPSKCVNIKKFYCRKDQYYWPVCEVELNSLIEKMEFFILNKMNINEYKKLSRKYAEEKLSWFNNKDSLNKLFKDVKEYSIDTRTLKLINKYDNRLFPYITKVPKLYSFLYTIYKKVK